MKSLKFVQILGAKSLKSVKGGADEKKKGELKALAQDIRVEVQDMKNEG